MHYIDNGPWAGNSEDLAETLRAYAKRYEGEEGVCIRGPFAIDVTHKTLTQRALPKRYLDAELRWFHTDSDNIVDLAREYGQVPVEWRRVAAPDGTINGQYGWCIWSPETGYQYRQALSCLKSRADREGTASRRAVMVYTHRHFREWAGRRGAQDPMCTVSAQVLWAAPGRMTYVANMRATDVIFGYTADTAWHRHVITRHLLPDLGREWQVMSPRLVLVSNSLQIYKEWMGHVANSTNVGERCEFEGAETCDVPGDYDNSLKGFRA